jgi:hypothetical protein
VPPPILNQTFTISAEMKDSQLNMNYNSEMEVQVVSALVITRLTMREKRFRKTCNIIPLIKSYRMALYYKYIASSKQHIQTINLGN